jgi:hypothetical protein
MSIMNATPAPGDWDYRALAPIPFEAFAAELLALYAPPHRAKNTWLKMRQVLEILRSLISPEGTTAELTPTLRSRSKIT